MQVGKKINENEPFDHALGRSRGGFGTKINLVTDSHGIPLSMSLMGGNQHDSSGVLKTLQNIRIEKSTAGRPRTRPKKICADKAYTFKWIRSYLKGKGIGRIIPTKSNQRKLRFDDAAYKGRNIIERSIGWLKEMRRIGTRYDKLAVNFKAMVELAMIRLCFRFLDSSDRA